jgi:hypothetical protein
MTYKNWKIQVDFDYEDDNVKAWHYFTNVQTGEKVTANITPYDSSDKVCRLFVDAGLPRHRRQVGNCSCNWDQRSLRRYIARG